MEDRQPDAASTSKDSEELHAGSIVAGRYQLEEELAKGGMGCLWVASDPRLGRRVAVKLISSRARPATMPEMRDRFEREARAAAKLRSPHVVQIHDYGHDGGHAYMVMELLEGEDLGKRLRARPRLPLAEVGKIVEQAGKALEHIHGAGMLHRDLKPGNVFLARDDGGEETVKIIDFGIVRTSESGRWTFGPVGTPRYMSPEQFTGLGKTDARSDLWSLAVIAYRALTGKHPFEGQMLAELGVQIEAGEFPPPTRIARELPSSTDAFFAQALAHAPEARFSSAAEMTAAFARICRDGVTATRIQGTSRALAGAAPRREADPPPSPPRAVSRREAIVPDPPASPPKRPAVEAPPPAVKAPPPAVAAPPPAVEARPPSAVEARTPPPPDPPAPAQPPPREEREVTRRSAPDSSLAPAVPVRARSRFARPVLRSLPALRASLASITAAPRALRARWWWIPAAFVVGAGVAAVRSFVVSGVAGASSYAATAAPAAISAPPPAAATPVSSTSAAAPPLPARSGPRRF